jgi:7,8-dihydroneopterin aldolase/epimerase/oxygenase
MSDHIILTNLRFDAIHGVHDWEREAKQPFEVDLELWLDLAPAGRADDLTLTVDYGRAYAIVAAVMLGPSRSLLESIAGAIASECLGTFTAVDAVVVRVRKPGVRLGGPLDHASVEIRRDR